MEKKRRVAIIFGGQSSEHEVSRVSAQSVLKNIDRNQFDIAMIGITKEGRWLSYDGPVELLGTGEWQAIAESKATNTLKLSGAGSSARDMLKISGEKEENGAIDVVFPVLHGCNGEDGTIQGMFELAGIPYVGCGVLGSAVGMDKGYSKIIFEKAGIPQGDYLIFSRKQIEGEMAAVVEKIEQHLCYPCFVKPCNAGSSVGVSKARNREQLIAALLLAAPYDRRILIEEFINGREIECAVLGNEDPIASTVGEVIPCNEFYDYEAKYQSGDDSKIVIPAELPTQTMAEIKDYAVKAFKALDCAGLSRVDFFVHKETGKVYINEINTMPGFTSISMYAKLWNASGIPYSQLVERLIDLAIERYHDSRRTY